MVEQSNTSDVGDSSKKGNMTYMTIVVAWFAVLGVVIISKGDYSRKLKELA